MVTWLVTMFITVTRKQYFIVYEVAVFGIYVCISVKYFNAILFIAFNTGIFSMYIRVM